MSRPTPTGPLWEILDFQSVCDLADCAPLDLRHATEFTLNELLAVMMRQIVDGPEDGMESRFLAFARSYVGKAERPKRLQAIALLADATRADTKKLLQYLRAKGVVGPQG